MKEKPKEEVSLQPSSKPKPQAQSSPTEPAAHSLFSFSRSAQSGPGPSQRLSQPALRPATPLSLPAAQSREAQRARPFPRPNSRPGPPRGLPPPRARPARAPASLSLTPRPQLSDPPATSRNGRLSHRRDPRAASAPWARTPRPQPPYKWDPRPPLHLLHIAAPPHEP